MDDNHISIAKAQHAFSKLLSAYMGGWGGYPSREEVLSAYRHLNAHRDDDGTSTKVSLPPQFSPNDTWQSRTIETVARVLSTKLREHVTAAILHGSYGSGDPSTFSDLDLIIILSPKTFENEKELWHARKHLRVLARLRFKIDPLQHHGFLYLTPFDLVHFPAFTVPHALWKYGQTLMGAGELVIQNASQTQDILVLMRRKIEYFKTKLATPHPTWNIFQFKNDLAQILIWPSLVLQVHGNMLYKRESFEEVKNRFPHFDWSPVDQASSLRREWEQDNAITHIPDSLMVQRDLLSRTLLSLYLNAEKIKPAPVSNEDAVRLFTQFLALAEKTYDDIV